MYVLNNIKEKEEVRFFEVVNIDFNIDIYIINNFSLFGCFFFLNY